MSINYVGYKIYQLLHKKSGKLLQYTKYLLKKKKICIYYNFIN